MEKAFDKRLVEIENKIAEFAKTLSYEVSDVIDQIPNDKKFVDDCVKCFDLNLRNRLVPRFKKDKND